MDSENNIEEKQNLHNILIVLLEGKWIIFSVTTFISILAIFYSLSLPNIYTSKVLLYPNDSSKSGSLGNYSNIASLAGIELPSVGGDDNSKKAIKKLDTLSFFENNILPKIFLPDLMAFKSWDPGNNINNYDEKIYDLKANTWLNNNSISSQENVPSPQKSFLAFQTKHFAKYLDKRNNFLTVSVSHQSPHIAKEWAELVINQINTFYRHKDKSEAEKAIKYLNVQINKTNLSEVKQVIAKLLQQETQKLTLIEANEYYVFEYIDPPAVMERKSEPSRARICIFGAILGLILSILLVYYRYYLKSNMLNFKNY